MARLPKSGADDGIWGEILNQFLLMEHNSDGTLREDGTLGRYYEKQATGIPEGDLSSSLQIKLNGKESTANKSSSTSLGSSDVLYPTQNAVKTYVDTQVASGVVADATTVTKGKLQLTGDLGGNASSPTTPTAVHKTGDETVAGIKTRTGRDEYIADNFSITNPPIRFRNTNTGNGEDAKGNLIEWGMEMQAGVNYPYGVATNAYAQNPTATFTVPTTGYKKLGWILTHYDSPTSTGEAVHQHLNLETVKADYLTVVTRLQISFGEDIALVSFPNSHVKVFNDKNFQIGTDASGAYIKHDTALAKIIVSGATTWRWASTAEYVSAAPGGIMFFGGVNGESVNRFSVNTSGRMEWGSGAITRDTNLYRSAADTLKTDDKFIAEGGINVGSTPTPPASASAAGVAGDIRYDANFIYICTATNTWRRAALSAW